MTALSRSQLVRVADHAFPYGADAFTLGPILIAIRRSKKRAVADPGPTLIVSEERAPAPTLSPKFQAVAAAHDAARKRLRAAITESLPRQVATHPDRETYVDDVLGAIGPHIRPDVDVLARALFPILHRGHTADLYDAEGTGNWRRAEAQAAADRLLATLDILERRPA